MTDKELLEMAAKAVGNMPCLHMEGMAWQCTEKGLLVHRELIDGCTCDWWNPLTDDGDALRLAVKLGLTISIDVGAVNATMVINGSSAVRIVEKHDVSSDCATKRAIVRAAAEIGKGLPK